MLSQRSELRMFPVMQSLARSGRRFGARGRRSNWFAFKIMCATSLVDLAPTALGPDRIMGMDRWYPIFALGVGFAAASSACSSLSDRLRPAHDAHAVAGMVRAAADADNQIEVIAQTGVWPGDARVMQHVEPVRIRVGNYGDRPVHVRYEHFRLVSPEGRSYPVVPPVRVQSEASASARRIIAPRFVSAKYRVAPHYGAATYPAITKQDGEVPSSPATTRGRTTQRRLEGLPTAEMISWAIPEGVLEVFGYVEGYLFFERVRDEDKRVELRAFLTAPRAPAAKAPLDIAGVSAKAAWSDKTRSGEIVADVSIPFVVE
jgi:hypothetical protein